MKQSDKRQTKRKCSYHQHVTGDGVDKVRDRRVGIMSRASACVVGSLSLRTAAGLGTKAPTGGPGKHTVSGGGVIVWERSTKKSRAEEEA